MPWEGDLSELGKLQDNLGRLAEVPSRAATAASGRIQELIEAEFQSSTDPYGQPWAELAESTVERKGGDDTILVRDGALQSPNVHPMRGQGIAIEVENYAGFHQTGFSVGEEGYAPPRPVLPGEGMPPEWEDAIGQSVTEAFGGAMERTG